MFQLEFLQTKQNKSNLLKEKNALLEEKVLLIEDKTKAEAAAARLQEVTQELGRYKPTLFGLYRKENT